MKKTLCMAVIAAFIASPAMAYSTSAKVYNMENPLFIPLCGQIYSKTSAGLMYKETDDSLSLQAKNRSNVSEFPIYRANESFGYGMTDRLTARGYTAYSNSVEIKRQGLTDGRFGLNYRIFDGMRTDGWVWDMYADLFMGGITRMRADLVASPNNLGGTYPLSFNYFNYSTGRYGAWLGTQLGKTWCKFTASVFGEVERLIGNNNNKIAITDSAKAAIKNIIGTGGESYVQGLPQSFNVFIKSAWEYSAGINGFYELNDLWAFRGRLTYRHHSSNTVEGVNIDVATVPPLSPSQVSAITNRITRSFLGNLQDGWDEYILTGIVARMISSAVQVVLYGEYTFDTADAKSYNGTNVKAEAGFRLNLIF
jgi:hypothetical protein